MIHKHQFATFVDLWVNVSLAVKQDKEADKEFGWVQEMYAYSIAAATAPDGPIRHELKKEFMVQPPWDDKLVTPVRCPVREGLFRSWIVVVPV